jgi:hypothetical protein
MSKEASAKRGSLHRSLSWKSFLDRSLHFVSGLEMKALNEMFECKRIDQRTSSSSSSPNSKHRSSNSLAAGGRHIKHRKELGDREFLTVITAESFTEISLVYRNRRHLTMKDLSCLHVTCPLMSPPSCKRKFSVSVEPQPDPFHINDNRTFGSDFPAALYIQAYEATVIQTPEARSLARSLEVPNVSDNSQGKTALVAWRAQKSKMGVYEDDISDSYEKEMWMDRYASPLRVDLSCICSICM